MYGQKIHENSYFLGCAHIQHKNITRGESTWPKKKVCRDFDTVEEMTEAVLCSIHDNVPIGGHLFLLGDFAFGDKQRALSLLTGISRAYNTYYIYGNHCDFFRKADLVEAGVKWAGDYTEMFFDKTLVCLFHYPIREWRDSKKGSWMLCSHSHGACHASLPTTLNKGKILDCGWDVHKKPISISEIKEIMSLKYKES